MDGQLAARRTSSFGPPSLFHIRTNIINFNVFQKKINELKSKDDIWKFAYNFFSDEEGYFIFNYLTMVGFSQKATVNETCIYFHRIFRWVINNNPFHLWTRFFVASWMRTHSKDLPGTPPPHVSMITKMWIHILTCQNF